MVIGREIVRFIDFYLFFVRLEEAVTALKSSLIFTPSLIVFHVFTEDHLREQFEGKVRRLT